MLGIYNALFLAVLLTISHGLLKWLSTKETVGYVEIISKYWWVIGLSISIYVFIFLYYAYILRRIPISSLYPAYTGLSIVFVVAVGVLHFGEPFGLKQTVGVILIVVGIFLLTGLEPA